ncbi:serine acetyltransferase [Paenibacillaceae bacterium]|nr:serine acetyltransferase [Paenibacillaceae bacterium]
MLTELRQDLRAAKGSALSTILANRGFHALLFYRISRMLWKRKIPLIPLVLTRFIQVLYSIDIDYRARIEGGCIIVHGCGLVIGKGAVVGRNAKLYHGVTLGASHGSKGGFPMLGDNVMVGCGAKLLGKITVGSNVMIGANAVVVENIPNDCTAIGIPAKVIRNKDKSNSTRGKFPNPAVL